MQPEFQKQMEQFKKDMEKEKREWQDIFKGRIPSTSKPEAVDETWGACGLPFFVDGGTGSG